ncbi:hypothetical protein [Candidatus Odyssella thessalonicensis]|nr:hypothetical protein [Candidatus Odyssella thessalonicensis]
MVSLKLVEQNNSQEELSLVIESSLMLKVSAIENVTLIVEN